MDQPIFCYKPDWVRAQSRWDAFWAMDATDRPCIGIGVPRPNPKQVTVPVPRSMEDKWLDPEYILAEKVKVMEETCYCGEAPPTCGHFMAGTTTGCNGHLCFHDGGISLRPSMSSMDEPLGWHPGPGDPWRAKVDAILNRLLDEAPGRFMVPCPGQFEHVDLLNMIRGNEAMMLDLALAPDQCKARLKEMRELSFENNAHFQGLLAARQGDVGTVNWIGVWRRRYFHSAQADVAAMLSPAMFEEFVLPELDWQGERYACLFYHTCGYWQHLDLCLSRPYIRVIQYSPNNKESQRHEGRLEFYRRVQKARRCLCISVATDELEFVIRHLRPEGLFIGTGAKSVAEADELLDKAVKWAGTHASR